MKDVFHPTSTQFKTHFKTDLTKEESRPEVSSETNIRRAVTRLISETIGRTGYCPSGLEIVAFCLIQLRVALYVHAVYLKPFLATAIIQLDWKTNDTLLIVARMQILFICEPSSIDKHTE